MTETNINQQEILHTSQGVEEPMNIESLCMNCHRNGITKLLLVNVPYFKKIVVSSFCCEYCGNKNEHIQSVEACASKGIHFELKIKTKDDLNRFVVRQETATVIIPQLEFESPPVHGRSSVTPIEGLIKYFIDGLDMAIENHKEEFMDIALKLGVTKDKMCQLLDNYEPFTLIIDDPSGNSFIENIHAPSIDPNLIVKHYIRNREQNLLCGILSCENNGDNNNENNDKPIDDDDDKSNDEDIHDSDDESCLKRFTIKTNCMYCQSPVSMKTQKISIPHFKDVLIFNYNCDNCGYKNNEVKSAGAIEPQGTLMTLSIETPDDISRDILKSDFCNVKIPELGVELPAGTLGSSYMTLESLLEAIKDQLVQANPFSFGDTAREQAQKRMSTLVDDIKKVVDGQKKVTFIMDDPTGNSYIQNLCAPDDDPQLKVEKYERTYEQNEELGLNDMKTENY